MSEMDFISYYSFVRNELFQPRAKADAKDMPPKLNETYIFHSYYHVSLPNEKIKKRWPCVRTNARYK